MRENMKSERAMRRLKECRWEIQQSMNPPIGGIQTKNEGCEGKVKVTENNTNNNTREKGMAQTKYKKNAP